MSKKENSEDVITLPKLKVKKEYPVPDALKVWDTMEQITPEYHTMMVNINIMIDNIAALLNEGPEVSDGIAKRVMSLDIIIKSLMGKVFISLYDRIAVLNKIEFEFLNDAAMDKLISKYDSALKKEQKRKVDNYVE